MTEEFKDYDSILIGYRDIQNKYKIFNYKYGVFIDGFGILLTFVLLSAQIFQYAFISFIVLFPDWQEIHKYIFINKDGK